MMHFFQDHSDRDGISLYVFTVKSIFKMSTFPSLFLVFNNMFNLSCYITAATLILKLFTTLSSMSIYEITILGGSGVLEEETVLEFSIFLSWCFLSVSRLFQGCPGRLSPSSNPRGSSLGVEVREHAGHGLSFVKLRVNLSGTILKNVVWALRGRTNLLKHSCIHINPFPPP